MPRKISHFFQLLKSISLKQMIVFFSILLLFNAFSEKSIFAEDKQKLIPPSKNTKKTDKIKVKRQNTKKLRKMTTLSTASAGLERQPANETTYSCSETFQNKYSTGYIQIGYGCHAEENLCIAFYHIERNRCEGDHLIRYYCEPKRERLFSFKKIKCPKGCHFSGLSGACKK